MGKAAVPTMRNECLPPSSVPTSSVFASRPGSRSRVLGPTATSSGPAGGRPSMRVRSARPFAASVARIWVPLPLDGGVGDVANGHRLDVGITHHLFDRRRCVLHCAARTCGCVPGESRKGWARRRRWPGWREHEHRSDRGLLTGILGFRRGRPAVGDRGSRRREGVRPRRPLTPPRTDRSRSRAPNG